MNFVAALVTTLLVGGLAAYVRARNAELAKHGDPAAPMVLRLSKAYLAIGIVTILLFGALAALAGLSGTDHGPTVFQREAPVDALRFALGFVAFSGLGWLLVALWWFGRVTVDERGARGRDALLRAFDVVWSDVREVSANESLRWLLIDCTDGRTVRVSFDLYGAPVLVAHLRRSVPGERLVRASRALEALRPGG